MASCTSASMASVDTPGAASEQAKSSMRRARRPAARSASMVSASATVADGGAGRTRPVLE